MESGKLQSPDFPNNHPDDKICYWIITVSVRLSVALAFENIEESNDTALCHHDYVEIRDGGDVASKRLGKLCENKLPGDIKYTQPTGNQLFVKFDSNTCYSRKGFSAFFTKQGKK